MRTPTVFLYNLDTPKGNQIRKICLPLKIRVRTVRPDEYTEPLGALAGPMEPTEKTARAAGFAEEMLLLANFTNALLDAFLQGFRKHKIAPVALKAVLTVHNASWNSVQLYEELVKEHRAMMQGEQAHNPRKP